MAERRMFAKSIVLSDAFLDMPLSARCLYFTLGMLADDDGFVSSPKAILRQCGASDDDMKLLIAKRYILAFESGVIVIKHWKLHNYIQKDRYRKTTYIEERQSLCFDEKGAYTEIENASNCNELEGCIHSVSILDTQVIDRDRDRDRVRDRDRDKESVSISALVNAWNSVDGVTHIMKVTSTRKKALGNRISEYGYDELMKAIDKVAESDFLCGRCQNDRNWRADFDWFIKPANLQKVIEGKYDNRTSKPKGSLEEMGELLGEWMQEGENE